MDVSVADTSSNHDASSAIVLWSEVDLAISVLSSGCVSSSHFVDKSLVCVKIDYNFNTESP